MNSRRDLLAAAAALIGGLGSPPAFAAADLPCQSGAAPLSDADVAPLYDVDRTICNFDAAYYGAMPKAVHAAYVERIAWLNRYNSTFLRDALEGMNHDQMLDDVRTDVGRLVGASREEIALSSGGTEALNALIVGYARLRPGDQVVMADVDYDETQQSMTFLKVRRGVEVVRIALPEPASPDEILAAYDKTLKASPRARLLLLTHISNRSGLIPPVREIIALAKARGVDVILDSAQAVGQLPVNFDDLGADFVGFSLHKWVAAPLSVGGVYIRKGRLADIEPWLGDRTYPDDDIRARLPSGTVDFATRLTVPAAIAFHNGLGPERKLARLRALRDAWIKAVRDWPEVEIVSSSAPDSYGALAAFRLRGVNGVEATRKAQQIFLEKHRVLVVAKPGLASGSVLRVTPAVFTTRQDLDRLIEAIHAERGLSM